MKKWGFLLCVIVVGYFMIKSPAWHQQQKEAIVEIKNTVEIPAGHTGTISVDMKDQVHIGNLLLVNSEYPVHPEGIRADIVNLAEEHDLVRGYGLMDQKIMLSRLVGQEFQKMIEAAGEDDVRYFIISSGYRDFDKQQKLYEEMGSDYALPAGYSEHNLGLSIDVGSTLTSMSEAPEGAWLEKNAWKYGFILRYSKDKVNITGIQFEPWHFRYVGLPHSDIMYHNHLVLEEYLQLLRQKKGISAEVGDKHYDVRYYDASQDKAVHIPEHSRYEISGDNMKGVIVTVEE